MKAAHGWWLIYWSQALESWRSVAWHHEEADAREALCQSRASGHNLTFEVVRGSCLFDEPPAPQEITG